MVILGGFILKKEFIGFVGEYSDVWTFETDTHQFSSNIPTALDELLDIETKDGDKFKITIEKLQ